MELSAKLVRSQLNFFKPFVAGCSLETTRKGQDKLGELMSALHKREVIFRDHDFEQFKGAWVMPKDERRSGVEVFALYAAYLAAVDGIGKIGIKALKIEVIRTAAYLLVGSEADAQRTVTNSFVGGNLGAQGDYLGDSRTVDVHIKRLREKLEGVSDKWCLKTVWGVGYKFEVKQPS